MKQEYFSEDELEKFLDVLEENEMHEAPFYLKHQIMHEALKSQQGNLGSQKRIMSTAQKREWIIYNCKITLAAAAAILVLFLFPVAGNGTVQEEHNGMSKISNTIGEKSESICNVFSQISDKMMINCSGFQIGESEE